MTYIRIMWAASMLGFLAVLLVIYVNLPDTLAIDMNADGRSEQFVSKAYFFYTSLSVMILVNMALLAFSNIFKLLPVHAIPVPKRSFWTKDKETRLSLHQNFKNWMKGILLFINLLLIITMMSVYRVFDQFAQYGTGWMYLLVSVLLLGWLCFYFVLFSRPSLTVES